MTVVATIHVESAHVQMGQDSILSNWYLVEGVVGIAWPEEGGTSFDWGESEVLSSEAGLQDQTDLDLTIEVTVDDEFQPIESRPIRLIGGMQGLMSVGGADGTNAFSFVATVESLQASYTF